MCKQKVLHHSSYGSIAFCNSCKKFQLAFGTTLVHFSEENFKELCEFIHEYPLHGDLNSPIKNIWLPLYENSIFLVLTNREFCHLNDLFIEAEASFEVFKLLSFLNISSAN